MKFRRQGKQIQPENLQMVMFGFKLILVITHSETDFSYWQIFHRPRILLIWVMMDVLTQDVFKFHLHLWPWTSGPFSSPGNKVDCAGFSEDQLSIYKRLAQGLAQSHRHKGLTQPTLVPVMWDSQQVPVEWVKVMLPGTWGRLKVLSRPLGAMLDRNGDRGW